MMAVSVGPTLRAAVHRQAYREASRLAAEVQGTLGQGGNTVARAAVAVEERRGTSLLGLDEINAASMKATAGWGKVWPEWGDEIDGEMAQLRRMSFSAWRALGAAARSEELAWAQSCVCTRERLRRASEALYRHRRELEGLDRLLDSLAERL